MTEAMGDEKTAIVEVKFGQDVWANYEKHFVCENNTVLTQLSDHKVEKGSWR